jgi:hypothetical protein
MTWPPSIVRVRVVRSGTVCCDFTLPLPLLIPALIVLPFLLLIEAILALPALLIVFIGCRGWRKAKKAARASCEGQAKKPGTLKRILAMLTYTRGLKVHYIKAAEEFLVELR